MKFFTKYWIPLTGIATTLIATEIVLRIGLGLGNPVLSQADSYTGYRFQPNQKLSRFGKRIEYNQYSQRSNPIKLEKPQGTLRILMVGDSVLNGGSPIDQAQIITERLKSKLQTSEKPIEILNASAGSWGIGNHLGYLREFGTFQSDAVILQIGTHDLTQPTSKSDRVGHDPNYPTHSPVLAMQEAIVRYALPNLSGLFASHSHLSNSGKILSLTDIIDVASQPEQQFQQNMEILKQTVALVQSKQIPIYVIFTPNRDDLVPTAKTPDFKLRFLKILETLKVPVFDTHKFWSNQPTATVKSYFRDGVHLNESGNEAVANLVFTQLCIEKKFNGCAGSRSNINLSTTQN